MSMINEETKQKIKHAADEAESFAVLMGTPDTALANHFQFVPGMNLPAESETLQTISKNLREGLFNILVMGKFKNGKSTFVNSLIGKELMKTKATACTAVIASVDYGTDSNVVEIYHDNTPVPEKISLKEFSEKYILTEEDQDLITNGGDFDKFADISHAVVYSELSLFKDGLKLIDSPGLEEAHSRTKATAEFVPKANAIIFTLNAISLFSQAEKAYIADNFAGKSMRNVFFIINRINQVEPRASIESVIKPAVRRGLHDVFINKNGVFDEELYQKRVFFVDAYKAECAVLGKPMTALVDDEEVVYEAKIEKTGVPEFKAALEEFLNSDERLFATLSSTLQAMANSYQRAEEQALTDKAVRNQSTEERERNAELAKAELEKARREVEQMRKTITDAAANIATKIYNDLLHYVQTDMSNDFIALSKQPDASVKFGLVDMVQLAASNIPGIRKLVKSREEQLKPISDKIANFQKEEIENWSKRVPTLISRDLEDLNRILEEKMGNFAVRLDNALNMFRYGAEAKTAKTGVKGAIQGILAASNWDVSTMLEIGAGGSMNWGDFAKRVGVQIALDLGVWLVFGAPYIVIALLIEVISTQVRGKAVASKLYADMGKESIKQLQESIQTSEVAFKKNILNQFMKQTEPMASKAVNMVKEQEDNIARMLAENAADFESAAAENARLDQNLNAMHQLIDDIYAMLFGHAPNETEFKELAQKTKPTDVGLKVESPI